MFKYPEVFQYDNGPELKNDVIKLLEKHNVEIQRTTTKYKRPDTVFVVTFNKELTKQFFKLIGISKLG